MNKKLFYVSNLKAIYLLTYLFILMYLRLFELLFCRIVSE
jgi:hypothetical protein